MDRRVGGAGAGHRAMQESLADSFPKASCATTRRLFCSLSSPSVGTGSISRVPVLGVGEAAVTRKLPIKGKN